MRDSRTPFPGNGLSKNNLICNGLWNARVKLQGKGITRVSISQGGFEKLPCHVMNSITSACGCIPFGKCRGRLSEF